MLEKTPSVTEVEKLELQVVKLQDERELYGMQSVELCDNLRARLETAEEAHVAAEVQQRQALEKRVERLKAENAHLSSQDAEFSELQKESDTLLIERDGFKDHPEEAKQRAVEAAQHQGLAYDVSRQRSKDKLEEIDRLRKELDQINTIFLEEMTKSTQALLDSHKGCNAILGRRVAELELQVIQKIKSLTEAEQQNKYLQTEIDRLKNDFHANSSSCTSLEQHLKTEREKAEKLELERLQDECDHYHVEEGLKAEIAELQKQLKNAEHESLAASEQNVKEQTEIDCLKKDLAAKSSYCTSLERQLEAEREKAQRAYLHIQTAQKVELQLTRLQDEPEAESAELQSEQHKSLSASEQIIQEKQTEIECLKIIKEQQTEIECLKKQLDAHSSYGKSLEQQLKTETEKAEKLKLQLPRLQDESDQLRGEIAELQKRLQDALSTGEQRDGVKKLTTQVGGTAERLDRQAKEAAQKRQEEAKKQATQLYTPKSGTKSTGETNQQVPYAKSADRDEELRRKYQRLEAEKMMQSPKEETQTQELQKSLEETSTRLGNLQQQDIEPAYFCGSFRPSYSTRLPSDVSYAGSGWQECFGDAVDMLNKKTGSSRRAPVWGRNGNHNPNLRVFQQT